MPCALDHLVIAAHSLDAGVQWCVDTLGIAPDTGGTHTLMGTHNRLLNISSPAFARAYLEIIAIDPAGTPALAPHQRRWFDLDDPVLQASLTRDGAALVHIVARTDDLQPCLENLSRPPLSIDRGPAIHMHRDAPHGRLHWHISVREDGQRLWHGALPTLIQRDVPDLPTDNLPDHGLQLRAVRATPPQAATLAAALQMLGLDAIEAQSGAPDLIAELDTPRGPVTLHSQGR